MRLLRSDIAKHKQLSSGLYEISIKIKVIVISDLCIGNEQNHV
jgi:hypothetical protein